MLSTDTAAHVPFAAWTRGRQVPTLGTNQGAEQIPFQGWRRFKEAFAPELIECAIRETPDGVRALADPFGGSGTSALAGQFFGARPQTIEVNPYLADLIEAKLQSYDFDALARDFAEVRRMARSTHPDPARLFAAAPKTFLEPGVNGRFIFSQIVATRIASYRLAIEALSEAAHRTLFRVLLGGILIPVSNVVVSGKGRRYRQGWERRKVQATEVDRLFEEAVLQAIYDLRRYERRLCRDYVLIRGDARQAVTALDPVCLAVFSPPYPNSFDYTDVYNVELWGLGYLTSPTANRTLREATLRSHVQIRRDLSSQVIHPRVAEIKEQLDHKRALLWNPYIPDMIAAYFDDMRCVIAGLQSKLRQGGRMYMVVGDSRYAGIDIPVAGILQEMSLDLGLSSVRSEPFRSMRSSPQQGGRPELAETLLVLST